MNPVTPSASRLMAVPVTIWSAFATIANAPNSAPIASAPAIPPAKPSSALFVTCAARTDVMAAVSIIPSRPRLSRPLRSTTSSPSTARSSGVAATMASTAASIMGRLPQPPAAEQDQDEDDHRLPERGHGRGDVRGALQLAGAGGERAEEERRGEGGQRVELPEQGPGDSGIAVSRRESFEEAMRHAE